MKNIYIFLILISGFGLMPTQAQSQVTPKTIEFNVQGNCEMCKSRIEKAAKSVNGVMAATWDLNTKKIKVVFNSQKSSEDQIHQAISKMGYKTSKLTADVDGYLALPNCCQVKDAYKNN